MSDFASQVDAEDVAERRAAVEAIKPLFEWRQAERNVAVEVKKIDPSTTDYGSFGVLRRWLTDHDGERLYDDGHGLMAYLQESNSDVYASPAEIRDKAPALYAQLERLNCFALDAQTVQSAVKNGHIVEAELAPWKHRIIRSVALKVEPAKGEAT